ncbi:MAG: hypothetical protein HY904_11800 [Deltaproteobacteria bacterium]|nr:hypothetical protein [Deltaproteobacteria bacterium]
MADQLKTVSQQLAKDQAAAEEAERKARTRLQQDEAARRSAREDALSDEERFARAVGGMARSDAARKFDDVPGKRGPSAPVVTTRKKSDDELFLDAMMSTGDAPPKK